MKTYKEVPRSVLLDVLKYKQDVSLDIETNGLNATRKKIATLQLVIGKEGFFHDVRDKRPPHFDELKEVLETREVEKLIQNAAFEGYWLSWHWDIWLRRIWDTKIVENCIIGIENIPLHLLKGKTQAEIEEQYGYKYWTGLKYMVHRYGLGVMDKTLQTAYVGTDEDGNENYYKKITNEDKGYGMLDVFVLPKIKKAQQKEIERLDIAELVKLENRVVEVVYKMRRFGIKVDEKRWLELADANEKLFAEAMKKLPTTVANWNSDDQVKAYFKEHHGITIESYKDLPSLKGKNKILDQFIYIREEIYKYAHGYGRDWLTTEYTDKKTPVAKKEFGPTIGPDGRVHPNYKQIVNTGRMSCSQPNMQNNPANHEEDPLHAHKELFIPEDGNDFDEIDFGGQELGLMAAGSGEPGLIKPMLAGDDVHSIQATKYFRIDWPKGKQKGCVWPKQCKCKQHGVLRAKSKQVTFGMPYGLSPRGLAARIGVVFFIAKQLIKSFSITLPRLHRWLEHNGKTGVEKKEIRTLPPFNRYRNLELEEEWRRRNQGKNTPIQGSGADMLKLALVLVDEWIEKTCKIEAGKITFKKWIYKIVLVVHDSIVVEMPKKKSAAFAKVLEKLALKAAETITKIPGLIKAEPKIKSHL